MLWFLYKKKCRCSWTSPETWREGVDGGEGDGLHRFQHRRADVRQMVETGCCLIPKVHAVRAPVNHRTDQSQFEAKPEGRRWGWRLGRRLVPALLCKLTEAKSLLCGKTLLQGCSLDCLTASSCLLEIQNSKAGIRARFFLALCAVCSNLAAVSSFSWNQHRTKHEQELQQCLSTAAGQTQG